MLYQDRDRRRAKGSPDSPGAQALRALLRRRGPEAAALHGVVEPSTLRSHAEGHALPGYPFLDYYQAAGVRVREGGRRRRVELRDFAAPSCVADVDLVLPVLREARAKARASRKTAKEPAREAV